MRSQRRPGQHHHNQQQSIRGPRPRRWMTRFHASPRTQALRFILFAVFILIPAVALTSLGAVYLTTASIIHQYIYIGPSLFGVSIVFFAIGFACCCKAHGKCGCPAPEADEATTTTSEMTEPARRTNQVQPAVAQNTKPAPADPPPPYSAFGPGGPPPPAPYAPPPNYPPPPYPPPQNDPAYPPPSYY